MTSRTAWTGGLLNSGLGWTSAFGTEINSLSGTANTSVLSSVVFTNGTSLDQFMDIDFELAFTTAQTVVAGANLAFYVYQLLDNGTTYGDGLLSTTPAAIVSTVTPVWAPAIAAGSRTNFYGINPSPILIQPGSFCLALTNNSGFAFASSGLAIKLRTYNQNLNS